MRANRRVRGRTFDHAVFVAVVVGGSGAVGACSSVHTGDGPSASGANSASSSGAGGMPLATGGGGSSGSPSLVAGSAGTSLLAAGSAGTSPATAGSAGASSAAAGSGGSISNDPACPPSLTEAFPASDPPTCAKEGLSCALPVTCTSGVEVLTAICQGGAWKQGAVGCDKPYDFCPGVTGLNGARGVSVYCQGGKWSIETHLVGKADGPGSCPAVRPSVGGPCIIGGTGGTDREHCGYPCGGESVGWTVLSCVAPGVWTSDGVCK